jgi:AcrR family transcriptional regulator
MSAESKILNAGRDVFLRDGYGASIDAVAAEAGVARRTVFNRFGSKEALFEAILLQSGEESLPKLVIDAARDPRTALLAFANSYAEAIMGPSVIMIYRMLRGGGQASAERLHELQHEHYLNLRNMLAVYFADCVAAGVMKPFNTKFGAERFMASAVGMARVEVSLGIEPQRDDRAAYIESAVDGFLDGVLA